MTDGYRVEFAPAAQRDLGKLPPRIQNAIIEFAFGELARNPQRVGKPLQRELAGRFSARRGPYRIVYQIHEETVLVLILRVAHRADIYFPR